MKKFKYEKLTDWPEEKGWYWMQSLPYHGLNGALIPVEVSGSVLWREGEKRYKHTIMREGVVFYRIPEVEE